MWKMVALGTAIGKKLECGPAQHITMKQYLFDVI